MSVQRNGLSVSCGSPGGSRCASQELSPSQPCGLCWGFWPQPCSAPCTSEPGRQLTLGERHTGTSCASGSCCRSHVMPAAARASFLLAVQSHLASESVFCEGPSPHVRPALRAEVSGAGSAAWGPLRRCDTPVLPTARASGPRPRGCAVSHLRCCVLDATSAFWDRRGSRGSRRSPCRAGRREVAGRRA